MDHEDLQRMPTPLSTRHAHTPTVRTTQPRPDPGRIDRVRRIWATPAASLVRRAGSALLRRSEEPTREKCRSAEGCDRVGDGEGALGGLDVEVLDHPAVVGDDTRALTVLPRLDQPAGVIDGLLGRRE